MSDISYIELEGEVACELGLASESGIVELDLATVYSFMDLLEILENHSFHSFLASADRSPCKMNSKSPWQPTKMLNMIWKTRVTALRSELVARSPKPQPSPKTVASPIAIKAFFLVS